MASANQKYCTPEFVFDNVFTRHYTFVYLVFLISVVPAIVFFLLISRFFAYGGLALSFGVLILIMSLIVKEFSKSVRIYFDEKSIFISDTKGDFIRFLKKDIAGICSFDYQLKDKPNISITIALKNGKMIHLNDSNLFERTDPDKAQMLRQFFSAATKRLDLTYVKKDRWRALQRLGANWYAPS